ncbi:pyridoxamine 5'-phosphate oxidase family protein [Phyllobacterium phragmitis]|uniref:Pyridoxamine 5'-phosphate oxidase family protein n=1 Tax=Phyllobacterium phragmitis TaxID=2670329 RepID=A0ABQ0H4I7_9HYPH
MWIRTLSDLDCIRLLESNRLGRLACVNDGRPYVVPVFCAYGSNRLYAFSMPGKKIDWMRANPMVSVPVEQQEAGREWRSVIVDGRYEELPDCIGHKVERDHAWTLLSKHACWWEPGALKLVTPPVSDHSPHVFFCIHIEQMSGREARE